MDKIMIDKSRLNKSWRNLEPRLKLLWFTIWSLCDECGIYEIDIEELEFRTGIIYGIDDFELLLPVDIFKISDDKYLIYHYIEDKYGKIHPNENYNPHKATRRDLEKNNLNLDASLKFINIDLEKHQIKTDQKKTDEPLTNLKPTLIKGSLKVTPTLNEGLFNLAPTLNEGSNDQYIYSSLNNINNSSKKKNKRSTNQRSKEKTIDNGFEEFWNLYDKKISRGECEKLWAKLKKKDKDAIMQHIPKYIESQPYKLYRKHPETYLKNRSWEDEVIFQRKSIPDAELKTTENNPFKRAKTLTTNDSNDNERS